MHCSQEYEGPGAHRCKCQIGTREQVLLGHGDLQQSRVLIWGLQVNENEGGTFVT